MKYTLLYTLLALLSGCASLVGKDGAYLISKKGLPELKQDFEGQTIWQYRTCPNSSASVPLDGPFGTMYVTGGPNCRKKLYFFKDGVITKEASVKE